MTPGEGNGCPVLEKPMDRGAWWATVHRVTESNSTEWLTLSLFQQNLTLSWSEVENCSVDAKTVQRYDEGVEVNYAFVHRIYF